MVSEKIWGSAIGAFVAYGKDGTTLVPVKVNADGELVVNLEAATVNIGDVDVISSVLPTDAASHTGQDELKALIGEVQASPTSNTVLDRLKSAVTHLATIAGFVSGGHGQVDVLSSALPTGAATESTLSDIKTAVEGPTPAGTLFTGRTGLVGFKILQSFTRPSDGNAYIAGDAISNSTSSPAIMSQDLASFGATVGRFLVITNARVISSIKGSGLAANICIFPATFTATNDNAELSIDDATSALGGLVIPCGNNYTFAVNSRAVSDPGWWEMQLGATSTTLYWCLQAASGYTPTSGEVFTVVMEGFFL